MAPDGYAVLLSAGVTAAVALGGAVIVGAAARRRPARAALLAPVVMVASIAAGVAVATRAMVVAEDDYRTVLFVLAAGAPIAVVVGVLLARRVSALERAAAETAARERAERERDAAVERSRRETIRWLSHDLRTPLTGIRLVAENLAAGEGGSTTPAEVTRPPEAGAERAAGLARIIAETDRMAAMVDDIAELSALRAPSGEREPVSVQDLLSDAAAPVLPIAESTGVLLRSDHLGGGDVEGHPRQLTRALTNLLRNAVQHTPRGGRVVLSASVGEGTVRVDVTDGCGGIPEDDLDRVFEAGWRGDHARTSTEGRGMGLGLAIAREIARAHGGEVTLTNLPDGSGCRARLTLPAGS